MAHALSCPSYDENFFARQDNVAIILTTGAKLIEQPTAKVVVSYRSEQILRGSAPATGEFSYGLVDDDWPIQVDIGKKYIVPLSENQIQWGACSHSSYRFDQCTAYGLEKRTNPALDENSDCELKLLRRQVIKWVNPKTSGEFTNILQLSRQELEELLTAHESDN